MSFGVLPYGQNSRSSRVFTCPKRNNAGDDLIVSHYWIYYLITALFTISKCRYHVCRIWQYMWKWTLSSSAGLRSFKYCSSGIFSNFWTRLSPNRARPEPDTHQIIVRWKAGIRAGFVVLDLAGAAGARIFWVYSISAPKQIIRKGKIRLK